MRKTDINKATCNTLTSEQLDILLLIFKKKKTLTMNLPH